MIYGYIRVSTDKQTIENQRFEIEQFCQVNNLQVNGWIEETISGIKQPTERRLGKLLKKVTNGDIIICSELSRLGRSLFMIMGILSYCMQRGCRVWTIKDGYRLGDDIQSKVLAFAFGLSAEIERQLISQRTREALARRKAEGVILGRPKGQRQSLEQLKLYKHDSYIQHHLAQGTSRRKIAQRLHCSRSTLERYLKLKEKQEMRNEKRETRSEREYSKKAKEFAYINIFS